MDGSFGQFDGDRRWYAVKAAPRKELLALSQLKRQGFESFLPLTTQVVRYKTRTETLPKAFFPGYLFVRLSLSRDRWRSVNGTVGVISLVQFGDRPAPAPVGLIEDLQTLASETGELAFDDRLTPGAVVRVVGGPFDRIMGVFQACDANDRVRVLITLMSRQVSVSVPRAAVMAVE